MKRGHSGTAKKAALSADANDYVMQPNKSLDASGISGLLIDNLAVAWLLAAASTQPFGGCVEPPGLAEEAHRDTASHLRASMLRQDDAGQGARTRATGAALVPRRVDRAALWRRRLGRRARRGARPHRAGAVGLGGEVTRARRRRDIGIRILDARRARRIPAAGGGVGGGQPGALYRGVGARTGGAPRATQRGSADGDVPHRRAEAARMGQTLRGAGCGRTPAKSRSETLVTSVAARAGPPNKSLDASGGSVFLN